MSARHSIRMTNSNYANWKKGKISDDVYNVLAWAHQVRTTKGYRTGKDPNADKYTRTNLVELGTYYQPGCDYGKPNPSGPAQNE